MTQLQYLDPKTHVLIPRGFLIILICFAYICIGVCALAQSGEEQQVDKDGKRSEIFPPEDAKSAYWRRVAEIKSELSANRPPSWAGHYASTLGGGLKNVEKQHLEVEALSEFGCCAGTPLSELYISPHAGAAIVMTETCGHDVVHESSYIGSASEIDGGILLSSLSRGDRLNDSIGCIKPPNALFFLKAGDRHYLMIDNDIVSMANWLNAGMAVDEFVMSRFLLRQEDKKKAFRDHIELPKLFDTYLRREPLIARIDFVDNIKKYKCSNSLRGILGSCAKRIATINVGTRDGAFAGMILYTTENSSAANRVQGSIRLQQVEERRSIVTLDGYVDRQNVWHGMNVGWSLSSKCRMDEDNICSM